MSIRLAAGETALESWCLAYIHRYQEASSKVGIYRAAVCAQLLHDTISSRFTKVKRQYSAVQRTGHNRSFVVFYNILLD